MTERGRERRDHGPEIPREITGKELDRAVHRQLRSLPEKLAARVARHLVAAGQLIDVDPEGAYQHALAARARAARLAVVREACGEAAYRAGRYNEALTELRAARRMNGAVDYLPVIADCERALGRPERALDLGRQAAKQPLAQTTRVELAIVLAGARRDLRQPEMALRTLEAEDLRTSTHAPWVARLRYAYADTLLEANRKAEAVEWFHRAAAVDSHQVTDAAERLVELEGLSVADLGSAEDEAAEEQDRDG